MKKLVSLFSMAALALGLNALPKITMNGSTTVQPIAQAVAESYTAAQISVQGTGSGNGIKALIDGACDIATSSRKMKQEEIDAAKAKGVNPYELEIAKDGIAVIVNPKNQVKALTIQQVQDIYLGKVTNWKELGGANRKIIINSRDTSSGTHEVFNEKVLNKQNESDKTLRVQSNSAMRTAVAQSEGAIGYVGIGYIDDSVKALTIQNVYPSATTVLNGQYPLARGLYLFANGNPTGDVKALMDYIMSPTGQNIVKEQGFVPVR